MRPHLLEQVPSLFCREGLHQVLLRRCQNPLESNDEKVSDEVGVDTFGSSAHVVLLEARDPRADGGFDLSLRLHDDLERPLRVPWEARRSDDLRVATGEGDFLGRGYQKPMLNSLAFLFSSPTMTLETKSSDD